MRRRILLFGLFMGQLGCGGAELEPGASGVGGKAEQGKADLAVCRFGLAHNEIQVGICNDGTQKSQPTRVAIYVTPNAINVGEEAVKATRCTEDQDGVQLPTAKAFKTIELGPIDPGGSRDYRYGVDATRVAMVLIDPTCSLDDGDSSNNWAQLPD